MKKTILLLLTILLTSCNSNSQGIKDNGKIENGIYTSNRFDWKIKIPNGYEIRTVKDEQDLEEVGYDTVKDNVPDGMTVRKNRPYLVGFGIDEKNYFSASFEPLEGTKKMTLTEHQKFVAKLLSDSYATIKGIKSEQELENKKIGDYDFNLINEQNILSMDVFGNYSSLEIIESSRTEIKFINAGWFYDLYPKMRLKSQFQTIDFNDKFQAKLPIITDAPDCLSYGETATIYGEDFPRVGSNFNSQFNLQIGGVSFSAASIYRDSIVLNIDDGFYTDFILEDVVIQYLGEIITYEKEICVDEPWIKVSFDNPQHQPHNYQNETYGIVYQNNNNFITVGKLNTETYHFESVINEQLPEYIRYGNLRAWHEDKMYHYDTFSDINEFYSYNFLNGNVTELAPFPGTRRVNGLMTCVGDYIYLGFGINSTFQSFNDLWRYSIANNTWEFMLTYPGINTYQDAITEPLTFAFENRLFFGGTNSNDNSNLFWEIDLNTFSLLPKSNVPITDASEKKGVTLDSKGYFEFGYLYEYDLLNDQWIIHEDINGIGFVYPDSIESLFINNGNFYRSVTTSSPYHTLLLKMNMIYLED